MLSRLVSESFGRGTERLIGERISLVGGGRDGGGAGGGDCGSRIGSEGEEEAESVVVEDSSDFVSVFFNSKSNEFFVCLSSNE
jgi:hypothetical protein